MRPLTPTDCHDFGLSVLMKTSYCPSAYFTSRNGGSEIEKFKGHSGAEGADNFV
jgi:hypothetical protein